MSLKDKYEKLIQYAIDNAESDRTVSQELVDDFIRDLKSKQVCWQDGGAVGVKYIEALQRSNDQLIKMASILGKHVEPSEIEERFDGDLSEDEFNKIYDDIKKAKA